MQSKWHYALLSVSMWLTLSKTCNIMAKLRGPMFMLSLVIFFLMPTGRDAALLSFLLGIALSTFYTIFWYMQAFLYTGLDIRHHDLNETTALAIAALSTAGLALLLLYWTIQLT